MKSINPFAYARAGRIFEENLPLNSMERLAPMLLDTQGQIIVGLYFDTDAEGQAYCSGNIKATLILACQRCMDALEYQVDINVRLGLVRTEQQVAQLAKKYEPVLITKDEISLCQLVEDELVLVLPAYAKHDKNQCTGQTSRLEFESKKNNPFAVLTKLKK